MTLHAGKFNQLRASCDIPIKLLTLLFKWSSAILSFLKSFVGHSIQAWSFFLGPSVDSSLSLDPSSASSSREYIGFERASSKETGGGSTQQIQDQSKCLTCCILTYLNLMHHSCPRPRPRPHLLPHCQLRCLPRHRYRNLY
jgi:hypothetical protein